MQQFKTKDPEFTPEETEKFSLFLFYDLDSDKFKKLNNILSMDGLKFTMDLLKFVTTKN